MPIDLDNEDDKLTVKAAMPGIQPENFEKNSLTRNPIKGAKDIMPASQTLSIERGLRRYDTVTKEQLETLSKFSGSQNPVLSLYLGVQLSENRKDKLRTKLNQLIHEQGLALRGESKEKQRAVKAHIDKVMKWFETEYDETGRGVAIFSSNHNGLWQTFRLPLAVRDQLVISDRPYVRPLMMLTDESAHYLVLLLDKQTARLFIVYLDEIQEYDEFKDEFVPKPKSGPGDSVDKIQRHYEAIVLSHVKHAIQVVERYWQRESYDGIIVGGTENPLAQLHDHLPKAFRERLVGEIAVPVNAPLDQVLRAVATIDEANARRVEEERVNALFTAALGKGPAVIGLTNTLRALVEGHVMTLIVEEDFQQPGFECSNCHFMIDTHKIRCPLCGAILEAQVDIVDRAMGRALAQNAKVEIVRGPMRQKLAEKGHIGALSRYNRDLNQEKKNEFKTE
ncbi:MAG: hypothetical protein HZB51_30735 [Chloroflexi bacterium]|nr:hypothetical protein [Chloroflexota bacterium]